MVLPFFISHHTHTHYTSKQVWRWCLRSAPRVGQVHARSGEKSNAVTPRGDPGSPCVVWALADGPDRCQKAGGGTRTRRELGSARTLMVFAARV